MNIFGNGLTMTVVMLDGGWSDYVVVLNILAIVAIVSSRYSSRIYVYMGSKAQEVVLEFFAIAYNFDMKTG